MAVLFYPKGTYKLGQWQGTGCFFNIKKCDVVETKWFIYILSFDAVDALNLECDPRPCGQGTRNKTSLSRWTNERIFAILWAMIWGYLNKCLFGELTIEHGKLFVTCPSLIVSVSWLTGKNCVWTFVFMPFSHRTRWAIYLELKQRCCQSWSIECGTCRLVPGVLHAP